MTEIYNIYCDESCHLEHDHVSVMVLGAVWCPISEVKKIATEIRNIKESHGVGRDFEAKWTKVSKGNYELYKDLVEYFLKNENLHFRGVVIPDKEKLRHHEFSQTHDIWYYKMFFVLLKQIFDSTHKYRIYFDIKDTNGSRRLEKLRQVLSSNAYDFDNSIVERLQLVRSHEVEILQISDLLIGATGYVNRGLNTSDAKLSLIELIKQETGKTLNRTTLPREQKFNLLIWNAQV